MLGRVDPYAMLNEMDEQLFMRWLAYLQAEPFGPTVTNGMLAKLCALSFGAGERSTPADYLPMIGGDDEDEDGEDEPGEG